MTAAKTILEVEGLHKSFGDNTILKGVSLTIKEGELKVLIGPSGGGKSTLLQWINCLVTPESGTISLHGNTVNLENKKELYQLRQRVGMIFQEFNLFDHLTEIGRASCRERV